MDLKKLLPIGAGGLFTSKGTNDFLFGKEGKVEQLPTKTKEQTEFLKVLMDALQGGDTALSDLFNFDKEGFNKGVVEPNLKNFKENILPMLQEGFSGSGNIMGSAQRRTQAKAGTDLQSKLAELMYQAQNQNQQNKLQGVNTALGTNTFENFYKPGTEGILPGLIKGAGSAAAKFIAG